MGMTREEAIRLLTTKRAQPSTDYQMAEVYTVAIKALKQEPTIKNDKVDCDHTNCINCVNHKYCDYETTSSEKPNKSEIPTSSITDVPENNVGKIEPTTKNDLEVDCISRADAIHAVSEALKRTFVEYEDVANKIINKLPSVTPIRPKGHWIDCDVSDDYSADGYDCSVCGINSEYVTSYCPNCGADMREVEE